MGESGKSGIMGFTTRDIAVMGIIGAVGGVALTIVSFPWILFTTLFGPYGAALISPYLFPAVLVAYLVRKRGAAFLSHGIIVGIVEVITGNPSGILTFGWTLLQGVSVELVFAAFRYRRWDLVACFLAAAIGNVVCQAWTFYLYGWGEAGVMEVFLLSLIVFFFAGGVESGVFGWAIGKAVEKSGLVRIPKAQ